MTSLAPAIRIATGADQERWDHYVAAHPDASPYNLFAWKLAVEEAYGHQGRYYLAEDNHRVIGVLPTVQIRLPLLRRELAALPFCDVGGYLADNKDISALLLERALQEAEQEKVRKISLRGARHLPALFADKLCLENHDKVRMLLPLPASAEILRQGFKSKLRSQINKAEKNGLSFAWGSAADLDDFFRVFSVNMRDLGSPTHSRRWFAAILKHYRDNARLGLVRYDQVVVGGCLLLTVADKVAIPWASTLRSYNRLAPNMLLYWQVLQYAADNGFATFDFGRSSAGEGTYKFKQQWGAEPQPLHWYTNCSAAADPQEQAPVAHHGKRAMLAGIWQKFPLPLANFLGPKLRKYISL